MNIGGYFSIFAVCMLGFLGYLYQDALDTLEQRNTEIQLLKLDKVNLQESIAKRNVEIKKLEADNILVNKNLLELQEAMHKAYPRDKNPKNTCEQELRERLSIFVYRIEK